MAIWHRYLDGKARERVAKSDPLLAVHYIGSKFRDILFNTSDTKRERTAIWKVVRQPHLWVLADHTWRWCAVNIPLNLVDNTQPDGDIDILVRRETIPTSVPIYRAFEAKSTVVNKKGEARSLKASDKKLRELKAQLLKLKQFGPEELYLLDVCIAQAGYDFQNNFPNSLKEALVARGDTLPDKVGYLFFALQSMVGFDEEQAGGSGHILLRPHQRLPIQPPFKAIVDEIESFCARGGSKSFYIGFCRTCRTLTSPDFTGPPLCHKCGKDLRDD